MTITESSSCPLPMFGAEKALVAMIGCWGSVGLGTFEVVNMLLLELLTGNGALTAELNSQLPQLTVHGMLFSTGIMTWLICLL